jgi:hypothetical protein
VGAVVAQEAQALIGAIEREQLYVEEMRVVDTTTEIKRSVALAKLTKEERVLLGLEKPEGALSRIVRRAHAKR